MNRRFPVERSNDSGGARHEARQDGVGIDVVSHGRTVENAKARCEELSLSALDEHVDVGDHFDGDAVDLQGTISPLPNGDERGVGEDRVTGADADG